MQLESDAFHAALEKPPGEREAFLRSQHGGDAALVRRVMRLLEAHDRAEESEFEGGAYPEGLRTQQVTETPQTIGPYRVIERIGEGGMGVVYAAEQSEPLKRRVAIKVLKLGMDTEEILARFEAERQAMALMEHQGVAKALDAGVTSAGRPYFVMELVSGLSLKQYCTGAQLGLTEKLRLFAKVCAAVRHAHQKGIIHRDLKPSNILIAIQDGQPVPKVIDFGIAKAIAAHVPDRTALTEHGALIGTPEYMSPEQAGISGQDVDMRTDVFALGVILYELVTGTLPIDPEVLRSKGFTGFLCHLREVDPPRPSVRLRSPGADGETASKDSLALARQTRGELDWVVMRAIEKDRNRRYSSVSALLEDVERFLADLPVMARPPRATYVLRKFITRHRYVTALLVLAATSALVGVAGLMVGLVRANRAEALAVVRADNSQAAAAFLERILFQSDPEFGGESRTLVSALEDSESWIESDLKLYPEVEASVRESIGVALRRKSIYSGAVSHLEKSLEIRRGLFGESHLKTASSLIALANLRFEYEGRTGDALKLLGQAANIMDEQGLGDSRSAGWLKLDIALVSVSDDQLRSAESAFEDCREILSRAHGAQDPDVSRPIRGLAMVAAARGDLEGAERLARQAIALCEEPANRYLCARAELVLASVLLKMGELDRAAQVIDSLGRTLLEAVGPRHIRIAERDALLCELHLHQGNFAEAERAAARCESLRVKLLGAQHWSLTRARLLRVRSLLGLKDLKGAAASLSEIQGAGPDGISSVGLTADHPIAIEAARVQLDLAIALDEPEQVAACRRRVAELMESRLRRL